MKNELINGDIVLVDGKSGIYSNGVILLFNGELTTKEPEYVIRIPEVLPDVRVYNFEFPELEFGECSVYVEIMQCCLKWRGYKIKVDGDFGDETFKALKNFRADCYLSGDTVCDNDTWKHLLQF